jgi:hypothetical protein
MLRMELWRLSKIILSETYFQAQLTSAGGQKNRFLERYEKNIGSMHRMAFFNMLIVSFFLFSLTITPLLGLFEITSTTITAFNIQKRLLANSFNLALYYMISFIIVLMFGLLQLVELMTGNSFDMLVSLPLSRNDLRQLGIYVFVRMHYLQVIVLILALPIISFFLIKSIFLSLALLVSNLINITFYFYLIIIVADLLGNKVFNKARTSRVSTIIRIITILFYLVIIFNIYSAFETLSLFAQEVYDLQVSQSFGEIVNIIFSLIPFPLSGGYLATLTLIPNQIFPINILITSLIGFLLLIIGTFLIMKRGNKILQNLGLPSDSLSSSKKDIHDLIVDIKADKPIFALMKSTLTMASRNYSSLFALLAPLAFTLIGIFVSFSRFDDGSINFNPFMFILIYVGFLPILLRNGLFTSEENLGGILSSLPIKQRDLFRSKQFLMIIIASAPIPFIFAFQLFNGEDPLILSGLTVFFLNIIASTIFLLVYASFFGKVHKYTLYTVNTERMVLKNFSIFIILNLSVVGSLFLMNIVSNNILKNRFDPFLGTIVGTLLIMIFLEVFTRKMFA